MMQEYDGSLQEGMHKSTVESVCVLRSGWVAWRNMHVSAWHSLAGEPFCRGLSRLSLNALWWCGCGKGVGMCPPAWAPGNLTAGVGGLCLFLRPSLQSEEDFRPCSF